MNMKRNRTAPPLPLRHFLASLAAPPAWAFVRYLFFGNRDTSAWAQVTYTLWGTPENGALALFLLCFASLLFWTLGAYGKAWRDEAVQHQKSIGTLQEDLRRRGQDLDDLSKNLNDKMKRFHQTNAQLQKSFDKKEVMHLAADSLKDILGYDRVNLLMLNPEGDRLEFMASRGSGDDNVSGVSLPLDERAGVLYLTMLRDEPLLVQDMRKMPAAYNLKPPCDTISQLRSRSFILCPIVINGEPVGLFGVDNKQNHNALNESDLNTVKIFAEQVAAALSKIELLQAVELLTGEIQSTFAQSLRHRKNFARMIGEVKRNTLASTDNVRALRGSSDTLYLAVDDTGSATSEISAAVNQVSENLGRLDELMGGAVSATQEISAAARATAEDAASSHQMAETVGREANEGVAVVSRTHQSLLKIAEAMTTTVGAFDALTERTNNIANFLAMIKEINQKTQLLSLNASILAAQAGEHGRAFAVVAGEIQSLYQQTSGSATAIEDLLEQIHQQTRVATREIGFTRNLVGEGVALGQNTEQTLQKIVTSADRALEFASSILTSSHEQTVNAEHTAQSIQEMGEIAALVSGASREQAVAITRIARQVEEIEGMAGSLAKASGEQEQNSGHIDAMMDQVRGLGDQIFTELENRRDESALVIEQLNQFKRSTGQTPAADPNPTPQTAKQPDKNAPANILPFKANESFSPKKTSGRRNL
jgi:methyl-accepting chemotaxis protein